MPTKKQHYIPRMLLKRFTTFHVPMRKPLIYQYDKNKDIERLVDIYDICRKKNLYEIKNESGIISHKEINLIENGFSCLESVWNKIIDKIEQNKTINQNDRCRLGVLLVLQLIRVPEVMKFTSRWIYDTSMNIGKPVTQNEADRYMKLASFVWGDVEPESNWILNVLLNNILANKNIIIYRSEYDFILNGERPVLCLKLFDTNDINNCKWFLPITKNHCIGLVDEKGLPDEETQLYVDINKDFTYFINERIFRNNGRFIYGRNPNLSRFNKQTVIEKKDEELYYEKLYHYIIQSKILKKYK